MRKTGRCPPVSYTHLDVYKRQPKIGSFLKYLDAGSCIALEDVTENNLNEAVDQAVAALPQKEQLLEKAQRLKDVERRNIQAVARLLEQTK